MTCFSVKVGRPVFGSKSRPPLALVSSPTAMLMKSPTPGKGQAVSGHPPVLVLLHHGLGHLDEVVPGLGRLQSLGLEDVLAVDQERGGRRVGDSVVLPVVVALPANRLPDVVPPDGVGDVLLVPQEALGVKGGAGHGLPVGGIRGRARGQGRGQLGLQVTPGQAFLLYGDVRDSVSRSR